MPLNGSLALALLLLAGAPAMAGQASPTGPSAAPAAAAPDEQPAPQSGPKVVEEGLFPKSFKIPGTDLSLGIGGYIKVDFIQDFDPIGDAYEFKVNSIPADGSSAAAQSGRTTIHARETRLNLDLRSEGSGGHHFRAFVEGDFFGDGNAFRLRHGYGEFGPILGGQTWSTFQDISARGLTIDFEGPDGEVFVRQAMIRFTHKIDANWTVAVAAENPTPQFAVPSSLTGSARSSMPDIPAYVRYQRGAGHVQVAGLLRQLRFDSTDDSVDGCEHRRLGLQWHLCPARREEPQAPRAICNRRRHRTVHRRAERAEPRRGAHALWRDPGRPHPIRQRQFHSPMEPDGQDRPGVQHLVRRRPLRAAVHRGRPHG